MSTIKSVSSSQARPDTVDSAANGQREETLTFSEIITSTTDLMKLTGEQKLSELKKLLKILTLDLKENHLSPSTRNTLLESVKILGRDPKNADPIFKKEGIETLARQSFDVSTLISSREALRCLANALFLQPACRQIFVDLGCAPKAVIRMQSDSFDDEFLCARLLFFCTYETNLNFDEIIDNHHLDDSINQNIFRHSKCYSKAKNGKGAEIPDQLLDTALAETLKLLFNISNYYPQRVDRFSKSIPHIFKILCCRNLPQLPLDSPTAPLINSLLNLDLEAKEPQMENNPTAHTLAFPDFDPSINCVRLIEVMDKVVRSYQERELDQLAAPLLVLLRKLLAIAPDEVKAIMQARILPSTEERSKVLGKTDSLSSKLLNLSTSPMTPTLRESISCLFFELSGSDPTRFVQNIGYGFASGFLMTHNMQIPENVMDPWSSEGSENSYGPVNPITGQRLDKESVVELPEWTDEEKEREAEKLFVLFERLRRTGVIDVKNPVQQAVEEGRFEELD